MASAVLMMMMMMMKSEGGDRAAWSLSPLVILLPFVRRARLTSF